MSKHRSTLRSPEFARKKRNQFLLKLFLTLVVLAVVLVVSLYLSHLSSLTINTIEIEGNEVITSDELDKYVRAEITGNYLWFFSKSNILIYPRKKIENDILRDFSRVQFVNVFYKSFKSIGVTVEERKPNALWCKSDLLDVDSLKLSDDCYFINQDGLVFIKAPQFSASVYVRYYGHIASSTDPVFAQYVPNQEFKDMSNLIDEVSKLGFLVTDVILFDDDGMELRLSSGGKILLSAREDFSVTLENFNLLLSDKITIPKVDDFIAKLNYVDLRFGKKLFFKLR
ncbi:hypothetical protein EXS61_01805 [Candidatus Parcubacteria bacterium]|nr:hypothetical protein [Candidatus Parcubacteria bacterium]